MEPHQPITPALSESSTEANLVGGTITSQLLSPFNSTQSRDVFNIDDMNEIPFFSHQVTMNLTEGLLTTYDPFQNLLNQNITRTSIIPMQLVKLMCSRLYDFDLNIIFLAIKHERARGKILITWLPNRLNQSEIGVAPDGMDTKRMRWLWDLEQSDTFSIPLKGHKTTAWRSRRVSDSDMPDNKFVLRPAKWQASDNYLEGNYSVGTLAVHTHSPYSSGTLGPDDCPILIFHQILNLQQAEYRPPYAISENEASYWPS